MSVVDLYLVCFDCKALLGFGEFAFGNSNKFSCGDNIFTFGNQW